MASKGFIKVCDFIPSSLNHFFTLSYYKQYNLNRRHTMSDIRKDSAVIKRYFCEDMCGTGWDKIVCGIIL